MEFLWPTLSGSREAVISAGVTMNHRSLQWNKDSVDSTLFGVSFSDTFSSPHHWGDNHALFRNLRSDFSQRTNLRCIRLLVCLARSFGLKIVKTVRLRAEVASPLKHEASLKMHNYKKQWWWSQRADCVCWSDGATVSPVRSSSKTEI